MASALARLVHGVGDLLPEGRPLTEDLWRKRHRSLVRLVWLHAVGLALFALARGYEWHHALFEAAPVAAAALLAGWPKLQRNTRSVACALGLVTASAVFVHLSGGVVEVHFHYFVIVGLLTLYQEWRPFLLAIGFVAVQHGVFGWLEPESVYNHYAAINNPWKWALIHGGFVLAASVASLVAWRLNEQQALTDSLTGLPNRALLSDRLQHAHQRRGGRPMALLFLDLDDFKSINDNLGHAVGDELLVALSRRLVDCLRSSDTIARLGGDEFAILIEELHESKCAVVVTERIMKALDEPLLLSDLEVFVTASVGVAFSDRTIGPEELLRHADMAMYAAKRRGNGHYELFEPELYTDALARMRLEGDLQRAVQHGEFLLHYQPVVHLPSGRIKAMEALVRWAHPELGLLPPCDFIGMAEGSSLIVPLGRWILREACRQTSEWNAGRKEPVALSVNLSPRQLQDPGVVAAVVDALKESGMDARLLMVEVTENVFVEDTGVHVTRLQQLRELGVRIAIDDFGTGYSSLSYLRRLPIDVVKIDRSFVGDLASAPENLAMVDAIVRLTRALSLELVAEGVDSKEQVSLLCQLGVGAAQGYEFAQPVNAEGASALILDEVPADLEPATIQSH